jgi:hypothetical protein
MGNSVQETLDALKGAQAEPTDIAKGFTAPGSATTGLQTYNLEAPAKLMLPINTPLRNSIARESGGYAIQANWKYFDGINTGNVRAGISEGKRGGVIAQSLKEAFAAFRGWGLENSVTFEAQYAAKNFDDARAKAALQTLQATMIREELLILGGNTSVAMGTTPTPVLAQAAGGSFTAATYSVICVALGLQAYVELAGLNNGAIGQYFDPATAVVPGQITRTNADGSTDTFGAGTAQKSASATIAMTLNNKLSASVTAVSGAVGYAWFVGLAGSERLAAISSINSVVINDPANGAAQLASTLTAVDSSTSTLDFDGLLYQAVKSGSGAYVAVQPTGVAGTGTPLTSDGAGGIVEFEQAFVSMYNKYRLGPTVIYVSSQELSNILKKVISTGAAPLLRLNVDSANPSAIRGGLTIGSYLNKITGQDVPIRVHPNLPAGTVFMFSESLPYPLSGVGSVARMLMRQDYYQIEWPLKSRKYEYGVYADGVLQHYAPFSMAVITNIANG